MNTTIVKLLHLKKRRSTRYEVGSKKRLINLLLISCMAMATHVGIMHFYEGKGLWESVWLTSTTIVTVGYGDTSATTIAGQIATIVLLYSCGIFVIAAVVDALMDIKKNRIDAKKEGRWKWNMKNHILIINAPERNQSLYFERLFSQISNSGKYRNHEVQVMMTETPSQELKELFDERQVVFYKGKASNPEDLKSVDADKADVVFILARDGDELSDSHTFDTLSRIRSMNKTARVVAETMHDYEQPRMKAAGASSVIRAIRAYPEMIVRSITSPGCEDVIVNLFSSYGDECKRFDVNTNGHTWMEVVERIMRARVGTAIAYIDTDGNVVTNPRFDVVPKAIGILALVKEDCMAHRDSMTQILAH